jgi:hypothetical protein
MRLPLTPAAEYFCDMLRRAALHLDHARDQCDIEFLDGRRLSLRFHLFTANELKTDTLALSQTGS